MLAQPYVTARSDGGQRYEWAVIRPGTGASLSSRETFPTLPEAVNAAKCIARCSDLPYKETTQCKTN